MSATLTLSPHEALEQAHALSATLAQEFEALRSHDIDLFEILQTEKQALLGELNEVAQAAGADLLEDPQWSDFVQTVRTCRDNHRRNELLLRRQLDAVRGTLAALSSDSPEPDLYDRLGQRSRRTVRALQSYA
jgi:flagellar biosynthesis/type III secretory pathway chaperone